MNTPQPPRILHVPHLALNGVTLIEASAGTGKTYTITSIYVRLVLGHGCTALSPEHILVVTFTRAATEELRSRIRARLRQAYLALQGKAQDALIDDIQQDITDIPQALQKLKDAQQLMDLAAIYTIHGFAQRLLRQHAVQSGINDEFELLIDETEILEQAVRDVWRAKVYPLKGALLQLVLKQWKTPDGLLKNLRALIYKHAHFHLGDAPPAMNFEQADAQLQNRADEFVEQWQHHGHDFIAQIRQHPSLNGTFAKGIQKRVGMIEQYLGCRSAVKSKDMIDALQAFTTHGLTKSVKKGGEPVKHGLSALCDDVISAIEVFEQAASYAARQLRMDFLHALKVRLNELKQQQQVISTDDLLHHVNQALNGPNQAVLSQQIRQQYPVAMVDEFQDTDAQQYQVFDVLYGEHSIRQQYALFMIGDPKQAIYKFRGADIFTYIQTKQKVDQQYTLDKNYRSTHAMVSAVNTVFTQHDHPFIYDQSIPFLNVVANGSASPLVIDQQVQAALSWVYIDKQNAQNKGQLNQHCAESCAEQISVLLNGGQDHSITVANNDLMASDVAVLVRNRQQAQIVKNSLAQRHISCVYVGQESVFDSEEAHALCALLHGVHSLSERQYRNAIAHPVWGLTLDDFKHFNQNEHAWEAQLEQLYHCFEVWQQQGVMAMVMQWLHHRQLPNQWLLLTEGERRLTNMMHLAELLQHAASEVQGMQGLLTWFNQQVVHSQDSDQKQLRLESDANLVQIVTIHKSKGLEYPVVFLPFNWDGKESSDELFFDEDKQQLVCDLADDFRPERIKEGLAEEVRLLYVGLTRAASKCYVTLPEVTGNKRLDSNVQLSALQHVLFESAQVARLDKLNALVEAEPEVFDIQPCLHSVTTLSEQGSPQALAARTFSAHIKRDWQLSSFSSLVRHLHAPVSPRFDLDDEPIKKILLSDEQTALLAGPFRFPRGAHAGNFLHTLLEEIDFTLLPDTLDDLIESLLARFGIDICHGDIVTPWLHSMLQAPLCQHEAVDAAHTLRLSSLSEKMKKVEMEFYFPVERLNAHDFNQLLNQSPCVTSAVNDLSFHQLKGMLKGFIDLTFEWQGQFFILDYKSNHLGNEHSDYKMPYMDQAMAEHRYEVQLVIYTLALHRLLALRLPDYDYDRHMGGGYYLFLRGLQSDNSDTGQFFAKPKKSLILQLDRLIKGESLNEILALPPSVAAKPHSEKPEQGRLL